MARKPKRINESKLGYHTGMGTLKIIPKVMFRGDGTEISRDRHEETTEYLKETLDTITASVIENFKKCLEADDKLPTDISIILKIKTQFDTEKASN